MTPSEIDAKWASLMPLKKDAWVERSLFGYVAVGGTLVRNLTTTYDGMGLVIAELKNRGWDIEVGSHWGFKFGDWCAVITSKITSKEWLSDAFSDTAPDAVALAAIKALEAE